jgi:hypothetical protein
VTLGLDFRLIFLDFYGFKVSVGSGMTGYLGHVAAVEEFAFAKISHKRAQSCEVFAPLVVQRALLQIFITNTFNHRLLGFVITNWLK